jgi:hypothetical protein
MNDAEAACAAVVGWAILLHIAAGGVYGQIPQCALRYQHGSII